MSSEGSKRHFGSGVVSSLALICVLDLLAPPPFTASALYVVPVLFTDRSSRWLSPLAVAAAATALILLAVTVSLSRTSPSWAFVHRALTTLAVWIVAWLHHRRLKNEASLRHNEALLRQAQDLARLGYWDRELEAHRITLSSEACRIFGIGPDEYGPDLVRWHEQWKKLIHPEDRERSAAAAATALAGGPRYNIEYRVVRSDGEIRFVQSCAEVIRDDSGRPQRMFGTMQDITELRQAETMRQTSEMLLRTFVDHATDAFFVQDTNGTILDVNRQACESLGYTRSEIVGKTAALFDMEFVQSPESFENLRNRLQAGETAAFEALHRRKNGSVFPVEVSIRSFVTEGRRLAVSLARDLTERKKAEVSLRLFRSLLDRSTDFIEVADPSTGRFIDVNEQACRAHGYTRDEYLALTVSDLAPGVSARGWQKVVEEVRREGFAVMEDEHRRKDGSMFPVEANVSYVRLDREYLLAIVRDTTARREVEKALQRSREHLAALIRSVDGIVWERDASGSRFTYVSPRAERLLGYPTKRWTEEASFWADHLHSDDRKRAIVRFAECVEEKRDHEFEYRMVAEDGRSVWLRDLVSVVVENGHLVALRGLMVDVTQRRRLEAQLRQSQKMEAIGQLAGGVAHDFNNILTAIIMEAELATMLEGLTQESKEHLKNILDAAQRAAGVTRRLLQISRQQVLQPRLLDLNDVVRAIAVMLQRLIGEDISLVLRLSSAPLMLRADPGTLDQVILNLAVNARDALPAGGRITIESGQGSVDEAAARLNPDAVLGGNVWLKVSDTGPGIPPDVAPRIFDPFFTTKKSGEGTGLGLATVYGIVKQHRGWIRVESCPGEGAMFQVFFPSSDDVAAAPKAAAAVPPRGGSEALLVVEDEDPVRTAMREILQRYGYQVLEAANAPAALELYRELAPGTIALLVTDLVMPGGMSGQELAAALRKLTPSLKVIYTSGYSPSLAGRELNLDAGTAFLQKPFAPVILLEAVRRSLDEEIVE